VAVAVGLAQGADPNAAGGVWGLSDAPADPVGQARQALQVKASGGWSAFPSYRSGGYLLYMPLATTAVSVVSVSTVTSSVATATGTGVAAGVDAVTEPVQTAGSTVERAGMLATFLLQPAGWERIAKVVLGLGLIFIGSATLVGKFALGSTERVVRGPAGVAQEVIEFKGMQGKSMWE
jgi:hypothetical protein